MLHASDGHCAAITKQLIRYLGASSMFPKLCATSETTFLIKTVLSIHQLKDIAEVARVIDEVDNEEWLIVFIGELEHRLRGFISMHVNENEEVSSFYLAQDK